MRRRAAWVFVGCLASLAGCKREPSFDERYQAADKHIRETVQEIDAQMSGSPTPAPRSNR